MEQIEGLFAVLVERPDLDPKIVGIGSYEQAVDCLHMTISALAKFNPEYKVRLVKITFLD